MGTEFKIVYDCFYSKITDDMYMELDEAQTASMTRELLLNALPWFEFPRIDIYNYDLKNNCFNVNLSNEEINIIATYMIVEWFNQQLASIEVARMKYSGSDFKFTSQANHMSKLLAVKKEYERVGFHLQRLYKRRKADTNGIMRSTMRDIMASSVREGNVPSKNISVSTSTGGGRPESTPDSDSTDKNNWEYMDSNLPKPNPGTGGSEEDDPAVPDDPSTDIWNELTPLPTHMLNPKDNSSNSN
jgi:hypothetical protein